MANSFHSVTNLRDLLGRESLVNPNKFILTFTRVPNIQNLQVLRDLSITAFSVNIPGFQILTDDIIFHGGQPTIYIPKKRIVSDLGGLNVSFFLTSSFKQRHLIEYWMHLISGYDNNNVSYFNDITGELNVKVYNPEGDVVYDCDYLNAFPSRTETIRATWIISDEWAETQVNFVYENVRINKTPKAANDFKHFGLYT
ncbi:MAG: hypothetical protein N3A54_00195 [Patescibacteria group bacterium]|nr:hypothetical protein [Patescibacteria group bacterium]